MLGVLPVAVFVVGLHLSGWAGAIDSERVRAVVAEAGGLGVPIFVAIYGLGILAHVPGSVFVAGGVFAFGATAGFGWSFLGALLGNLLSFGVVRWVGYQPLVQSRWPVLDPLFRQLADRPVWAVSLIRLIFPTTAPVNFALALSRVPTSAFLLGSIFGVVPQLALCVWLFASVFD